MRRVPFFFRPSKHKSSKASVKFIFNYSLARVCFNRAIKKKSQYFNSPITGIMPYGFELFSAIRRTYWPVTVNRHYPVIGYAKEMSRQCAEMVALQFQVFLQEILYEKYPEFHKRLQHIKVHNNG